jgi:hypothetical protein
VESSHRGKNADPIGKAPGAERSAAPAELMLDDKGTQGRVPVVEETTGITNGRKERENNIVIDFPKPAVPIARGGARFGAEVAAGDF